MLWQIQSWLLRTSKLSCTIRIYNTVLNLAILSDPAHFRRQNLSLIFIFKVCEYGAGGWDHSLFFKVKLIHCTTWYGKLKNMIWDFFTDFLTGDQREESKNKGNKGNSLDVPKCEGSGEGETHVNTGRGRSHFCYNEHLFIFPPPTTFVHHKQLLNLKSY